jgi:DNA repair exonuclease SbcCD ATPase subunit
MPDDGMKSAIVGGLIGAAAMAGVWAATYFLVNRPTLAYTQEQINLVKRQMDVAQKERDDARKERDQARAERNAAQKQIDDIRDRWRAARSQFVRQVALFIVDGAKPETAWEGKPHPSPLDFAKQIIAERDNLRREIDAIKVDLDEVYNNLDGDIDGLRAALGPPPQDNDQLRQLLERLRAQWGTKERLINALAEKTFLRLGCPQVVAQNP